jgi:hypothetical protein
MSPAAVPTGVGIPSTAMLSLIVMGTPSSALSGLRRRQRFSEAAAIASAPAAATMYMALMLSSQASMRDSAARVTSTGENSPLR